MVNYANGKIYKLVNNVDDKIYVGSTCGSLRLRKSRHKAKSNACPDRPVYKHLNRVGWDNIEIILVETYECKNKAELHARERHWIDELKPELNKVLPLQTKKEWQKKYDRQRYHNNKETEKERYRKYHERVREIIACPCGGSYNNGLKHKVERHKRTPKHQNYLNSGDRVAPGIN